jgi:putative phosphoribosyl transferase
MNTNNEKDQLVHVSAGQGVTLEGNLTIPNKKPKGIVLFAHGSGSSRHSPRNKYVAQVLQDAGIATLLIDLLSQEEEEVDLHTRHLRFDIGLLAQRLIGATDWLKEEQQQQNSETKNNNLNIGYFGASTGAAAALVAAAERQKIVKAVVSRGGRPDLAGSAALSRVQSPTLLIVGGNDEPVIEMNKEAFEKLTNVEDNKKKIIIIPGATHLFEEPGKLEEVARLAKDWFEIHLP